MKILLVHPPTGYDLPEYFTPDNLALGYLTSVLRRDGHEVSILDALVKPLTTDETVAEILKRDFEVLGVTANHEQKRELYAIMRSVRKERRAAILVAGGYLATLSTEPLFKELPELDFVVVGEGELVACDVFGRISRGEDWSDTPGVAFMKDGVLVSNPCPPLIQNLDSLPFPSRDALHECKSPIPVRISGTRGCYRRCSFCCVRGFYERSGGRAPRHRSPKNIVDEMESIISATGFRRFRFVDDSFLGPNQKAQDRAIEFADEIRSRKLEVTFAAECRADEVEKDIMMTLKEAGLRDVFLGIESGTQCQLDRYNKCISVETNRKAIGVVRDCGLRLRAGFIMFDPYLTVSELVENMQFVSETGIAQESVKNTNVPFITKVSIYHGTPLVERLRNDGLLIEKGTDLDYKFKDRSIRFIYHMLRFTGWLSGALRNLRRLGRKPAKA